MGGPMTQLIASILELAVPAWQSGITQDEKQDIKKMKNLHFISYEAVTAHKLDPQNGHHKSRRIKISLKFSLKAEKDTKIEKWLKSPTAVI